MTRRTQCSLSCIGILVLSFIISPVLHADGYFPNPYGKDVLIPGQLAVVQFKDGTESLIIQNRYSLSRSEKFGWVIPLPAIPEVDTESEDLSGIFRELSDLTTDDLPIEGDGSGGLPGDGGGAGDGGGIDVIEQVQVGIYNITILEAETALDMTAWLQGNGFSAPAGSGSVFQDYIDRGWIFVCMQLDKPEESSGALHPLRLTFPVDTPVYPMKLTEFSSSFTELLMYVITDEEKVFPQAWEEWGFYVEKATLANDYPLLDDIVGGDVFITKLRAYYTYGDDAYDDIVVQKAPSRAEVGTWPARGSIQIGDRHVFRARGGTPPYTWVSTNESAGTIDSETGEFAALAEGSCYLRATDAQGVTGSSGTITVTKHDPHPPEPWPCFITTAARGGRYAARLRKLSGFSLFFRKDGLRGRNPAERADLLKNEAAGAP